MNQIVLDTGALIALERNQRSMWAALKEAVRSGADVVVPSAVLAQAWRGTPGQAHLQMALKHCVVASFDAVARDVGVLCGKTRTQDICDAQVAIVASRQVDVVYTSDPADLRTLFSALNAKKPRIVRC
ncbi:MAG: hypothetical protein SFV15_09710 [Polyangiaceae bacterium]|nr:hypothetical protein [Polyangiaceae bacterium]